MNNYAIILASGTGERFGTNILKQFAKINDKTILEYSIEIFQNHKDIHKIIIISNPLYMDKVQNILNKNNYSKVDKLIAGGKTRKDSSYIGVSAIEESDAKVLIHDAVRPLVSKEIIDNCIMALSKYNAVNVAIDSSDTIIEVDENNIIKSMPNRKYLKRCQTPQCFDINIIKKAHELAMRDKLVDITDDCGLIMKYNLCDIYVIKGSENNIKITFPIDLDIAELIIKKEGL